MKKKGLVGENLLRYYPLGTKQRRFNNEKRRRVIVCGSRRYKKRKFLYKMLDKYTAKIRDPIIVTGDAPGADTLAQDWAFERGLHNMRFPADWTAHGKAAGPIRNGHMALYANEYKMPFCIAFLTPTSKGTKNMIETARKKGIKLKIIKVTI